MFSLLIVFSLCSGKKHSANYRKIPLDSSVRVHLVNKIRGFFENIIPEYVVGSSPAVELTSIEKKDGDEEGIYWVKVKVDGQKLLLNAKEEDGEYRIIKIGSYGSHERNKWRWFFPTSRTIKEFESLLVRSGKKLPGGVKRSNIISVRKLRGETPKVHFLLADPLGEVSSIMFVTTSDRDVEVLFDTIKH